MPAVNIFLTHRRFDSVAALDQFVFTRNGQLARFQQEVGFMRYDPARIQLVFDPEASSVYQLLQDTLDFSCWGYKVRHMAGLYDTAILVYEPNQMQTPEASSLYYVGRLVYKFPD
jgi:hypothetical protein